MRATRRAGGLCGAYKVILTYHLFDNRHEHVLLLLFFCWISFLPYNFFSRNFTSIDEFRVLNLLLMKEEVQLLWQLAEH